MSRRNLIWILILAAMATVLLLVWRQPRQAMHRQPGQFDPVRQAYELIRRDYYQPVESEVLQRAAVRGMVDELDEFTTYVAPDQAEQLTDRVMGQARGVGLVLAEPGGPTYGPDGAEVIGALPGSPAQQAGLGGRQRILRVDDQPVTGMTRRELTRRLDSLPTTDVEITYRPADSQGDPTRTITLSRSELTVETVQGLARDAQGRWVYALPDHPGLFYIRVGEFCPRTPQQLQRALQRMSDIEGVVLDLRDNPGGVLGDGVALADMFLDGGPIVTVRDRAELPTVHRSHPDTPYATLPMVVLINGQTASAAELLAGALGHNARAVLLGTRTRGKGCVQTMIRLSAGLGQLHLTTAEFYFDEDRPVQRRAGADVWGVDPHVHASLDETRHARLLDLWRARQVLPAPTRDDTPATSTSGQSELSARAIISLDPQLADAVELLADTARFQTVLEGIRARQADRQSASGPQPVNR